MIWLGGGYPELHAAGLSANHEMLTQLRAAHRRGVAIYAECGGLMYLGTTLEVTSGERYTMADIIPGHSRMGNASDPVRLLRSAGAAADAAGRPGEWLRGHEFHYSDFTPPPPYWPAVNSATVRRSSSGRAAGSPAAPLPAISCPFCPASHHAQPLAAGGKEAL
jgi:cobyrinic acid a,c-diamide synthase